MSIYRANGLLLVRSVRMPMLPAGATAESQEATNQWQTFVLKEVQRSLAFYNSETGRRGIDRIYLSGGRALTEGIAGKFTDSLKVETQVLNPLEGLEGAGVDVEGFREQGPKFALAMSLARRR